MGKFLNWVKYWKPVIGYCLLIIMLIYFVGMGIYEHNREKNRPTTEQTNHWYSQTTYRSDNHMILKMNSSNCKEISSSEQGWRYYLCQQNS